MRKNNKTEAQPFQGESKKEGKINHFHKHKLKKYSFSNSIKDQLKPFFKKNNYRGILAVVRDYICFALAVTTTILAWEYYAPLVILVYPLALILIGANQRALATLLHEASHNSLAKNKRLNFILGTYLSGYLIFQMFHRYVQFHCQEHHPHLGNPEKDPDYQYYESQGLFNIKNKKQFISDYLMPVYLLKKLPSNLSYLLHSRILMPDFNNQPPKFKREYVYFLLFWVSLISIIAYFGLGWYFFLFWFVPYLTTFQMLNFTIEVCEHYPIILLDTNELYMTRNRNGNRIERFLMGIHGEHYHLLHHLFPAVPFWKLPEVHDILMQDEEYRFINERSGGIITPSKIGGKTIIESMFDPLFQPKPI